MNISQPVSSSVDRVEFTFLTQGEIHSVSVKKIENDMTFDTLLNPVRGGLYDPALGSWGESMYGTTSSSLSNSTALLFWPLTRALVLQMYNMQPGPAILPWASGPHRSPRPRLPSHLYGPDSPPAASTMCLL